MKYLIILVLLIFASCQKKAEVYNGAEIKDEWNPGSKYGITTECNTYNPGIFIPYRVLGLENALYDDLVERYGKPLTFYVDTLVNGRSINRYDYDDYNEPREETGVILYDYVHSAVADSLFKDRECIIYNVVWRTHENDDFEEDMYIRLFFAGENEERRSLWGYKTTCLGMWME